MKFIRNIVASVLCAAAFVACTDLNETLYDQVGTQNYYNTKSDVRSNMLIGASRAVMCSTSCRPTSL